MHRITTDTVDSTNATAARMIASGEIACDTYITAREQTAGRGTRGRAWHSPRDAGLYMSVVAMNPGKTGPSLQTITVAAGIACAETLFAEFGVDVRIKPINDLILDGRKLGGILTEANNENDRVTSLIVGVGINLTRTDINLPPDTLKPAFLKDHLIENAQAIDRRSLASNLATTIRMRIKSAWNGDENRLRNEWGQWGLPGTSAPI